MNIWSAINADAYRLNGTGGLLSISKALAFNRLFRAILSGRLARWAAGAGRWSLVLPFLKLLHRLFSWIAAVDLPWQVEIGPGLAITHGWGLVVSPGARIGANVTLFHGVTIGRRDRIAQSGERTIGYPTLADEVWVGPHAIIIGAVTIGRGSRIAGGAFVTFDVPPHSVVSGNPARIVRDGCAPDVRNPAPFMNR